MKLVWTESAVRDLESIRDYIRRDSEYYASRFISRIFEAVETLTSLPKRGRLVPEADDPDIRELLFQNHRIMYRIDSGRIVVLTIIHAARDWSRTDTEPWEVV